MRTSRADRNNRRPGRIKGGKENTTSDRRNRNRPSPGGREASAGGKNIDPVRHDNHLAPVGRSNEDGPKGQSPTPLPEKFPIKKCGTMRHTALKMPSMSQEGLQMGEKPLTKEYPRDPPFEGLGEIRRLQTQTVRTGRGARPGKAEAQSKEISALAEKIPAGERTADRKKDSQLQGPHGLTG